MNSRVMEIISRQYGYLYERCRNTVSCGREDFEDIFQDCIVFMATDERAAGLFRVEDIIDLFVYRFRMIEFSHTKRKQERKEIPYADHLQAKEEPSEQ